MIFSWGDGKALAALIGKFRSDLVDYISLCSMGDPERMIDVSSFYMFSADGRSEPGFKSGGPGPLMGPSG
jgi:hypothetical protein